MTRQRKKPKGEKKTTPHPNRGKQVQNSKRKKKFGKRKAVKPKEKKANNEKKQGSRNETKKKTRNIPMKAEPSIARGKH